jgi:glycogen operon protein
MRMRVRVKPGAAFPLGATPDRAGVNFALFSAHATRVELCLFDRPDRPFEDARMSLADRTDGVWHGYVPGLQPGHLYGYRVWGPWKPLEGHRFNPAKVVLDPYARQLGRPLRWDESIFATELAGGPESPPDERDNAAYAPLAVVPQGASAADAFDWGDDRRPRTPWRDTIVYELHVKGFTALNDAIPETLRGTYLGLASEPAIRHLTALGVTTVELMPVHAHVDEWRLVQAGLVNYWGYNTLAYFVPDERFATGGSPARAVDEFKTMVRSLHAAGLEVVLDVVYNHTAEGDEQGPTLSWRGIDNASYYRLDPRRPWEYENHAGTGNTLDMRSPRALQLVMDSLRYWVEEMHVDGFRFDLASTLARERDEVDARSGFNRAVLQDPVVSTVKLIAEPWDLGAGGYQVGRFPPGWIEWNDRYRNTIRRFWRGESGAMPDLPTRLAGSSDLYEAAGRRPTASINHVTTHDGFTLADLVAYETRRNEANGELNEDGERHNLSWNSGVEGPSDDARVRELRQRRCRNFILTLMTSIGVPMISGGDEMGRTQGGNNNAYCHDSPLSWTPWALDADQRAFLDFVRGVIALRRSQPVLRRTRFLKGRTGDRADVLWLGPDGREMTGTDWAHPPRTMLGVLFDGEAIAEHDDDGQAIRGDTLLILLNADARDVDVTLPGHPDRAGWEEILDTAAPGAPAGSRHAAGAGLTLLAHSARVLRLQT